MYRKKGTVLGRPPQGRRLKVVCVQTESFNPLNGVAILVIPFLCLFAGVESSFCYATFSKCVTHYDTFSLAAAKCQLLCEAMPPQAAGFAPTTKVVSPAGQSFEKDSQHPV